MSFFSAPEQELQRRASAVVSNDYGSFRLSVTRSGGFFYAMAAAIGARLRGRRRRPVYPQGSWILKRSSPTACHPGQGLPAKRPRHLHPHLSRRRPRGSTSWCTAACSIGKYPFPSPSNAPSPPRWPISSPGPAISWTGASSRPRPGLYGDVRAFVTETGPPPRPALRRRRCPRRRGKAVHIATLRLRRRRPGSTARASRPGSSTASTAR